MENRSHLWISSEEIVMIENKRTARDKDRGIEFKEHGAKLSNELKSIVSKYQEKSEDSLKEEDIMIFKVTLPEGEKLSNKKRSEFLKSEGIKINAVKNDREAIVSTQKSLFERLSQRVNRYSNAGTIKDFQYIDGFDIYNSEEKKSETLKRTIIKNKKPDEIDVQIMLVPNLDEKIQINATNKIKEKIEENQKGHTEQMYDLSDGTKVIRAVVSLETLNKISLDSAIFRIEETEFFHYIKPNILETYDGFIRLDENIDVKTLPTVAILDNGIEFNEELEKLVVRHWKATGCEEGDKTHGTPVASKTIFSNIGKQILQDRMKPRAKVIDCTVMGKSSVPMNIMIQRIQEAVNTFKDIAKIFNLSANTEQPIDGENMSIMGYELDVLMYKYSIKFVISAGNHYLNSTANEIKEIIDDDDSRIASPADAMLGITVGAISGEGYNNSLSTKNIITPYSRIGPGFAGFRKPDIMAYGANLLKNNDVPKDEYSILIGKSGNLIKEAGTSFTAPVISGDLAEILSILPENNVLMAQALLYHSARPVWDTKNIDNEEAQYIADCYGRGISNPQFGKYSSDDRVTFIRYGQMNKKNKQRIKFYMPKILAETKKRNKAKVIVTCVTQAPIDRTKGTDYVGAYISASLHKIDSKGNIENSSNPTISEGRKKWDTCYHFEKVFSQFNSGDWEVWLELFSRWDIPEDQNIDYAIAITIEDLTNGKNNIYQEIQIETQGRFRPLNEINIPIKARV